MWGFYSRKNMSDNPKLWRYMDLTKFLETIIHQKLYFNRSDNFEDKHEGELDYKTRQWIESYPFNNLFKQNINNNTEKYNFFINCWHESDYESAAMWKLYGVINDAIAIYTDLNSLKDTLPKDIQIYKVQYFDDQISFDINDIGLTQTNLFTRKRKAFEHEKEYRAIYYHKGSDANLPNGGAFVGEKGINFKINVSKMIKGVVISPYASNLVYPLIESIFKKYEFENIKVINSKLYDLS